MKRYVLLIAMFITSHVTAQNAPCGANPVYRQFDFWLGEWEVFGKNEKKAGDSKITLILDSCILLEEWTSAAVQKGFRYSGKSFNTFNARSGQWQQTWVDNTGGSTEYLLGKFTPGKIEFQTHPFLFVKDTIAVRKLSFYDLGPNKIRQHGEISKDKGENWITEYDLEYRRK